MNAKWYRTIGAAILCLLLICQPLMIIAEAADPVATSAPTTEPTATDVPVEEKGDSAPTDAPTTPPEETAAPTDAPAPTPAPTEQATASPDVTEAPTPAATEAITPAPTATAAPAETATPAPTDAPAPDATPTNTATPDPNVTPDPNATLDPNATIDPNATPTPEPSPTPWTRTDEKDMNIKDIYDALGLSSDGILTGFDVKFYNGDDETDTPTIDSDAQISISFGLNDDVAANMRGGDTYTITLPDEISISQEQTFPLYNENGEIYATAVVGTNGKVVITFNDEIQNMTGVHGQLHFGGGLDADEIDGPGSHDITLPYGDNLPPVSIFVKPKTDDSIDKSGALDRPYNPNEVNWTVDFNKGMDKLTGVTLSDPMPAGTKLNSVKVYTVRVDLNGNVIPNSEVEMDASQYSVDDDGVVHFHGDVTTPVRVVYNTTITDPPEAGGDIQFANKATLTTDELGSIPAESSVTATFGKFLNKTSTGYDPNNQIFSWGIQYNYNQREIPSGQAVVVDAFDKGKMELLSDTIVVRSVTINDNGNPTLGDELEEGVDYQIEETDEGFRLVFLHDIDSAVNIAYDTKASGYVDEDGAFDNEASTSYGGEDYTSGSSKDGYQQNVVKSVASYDESNNTVTWKIRINGNHYAMKNWKLTDMLGKGHHISEVVSFVDLDSPGTPLVSGTDFYLNEASSGNEADPDYYFTLEPSAKYEETSDAFELTITTKYQDLTSQRITNGATLNWVDENDTSHESSSSAHHDRTGTNYQNGAKSGSYNAVTKEITWSIQLNYHNAGLYEASLVDQLNGDQVYVHDSLRIYVYEMDANGNITSKKEISAADYARISVQEPSSGNENTLTVTFPNTDEDVRLLVEFRTSLVGQVIEKQDTYDNTAVFSTGGRQTTLTGKVSIAHGGSLADKTGKQGSDGYVKWTATINPSQSTLNNVKVTDVTSDNQRIDMSSLVIYRMHVAKNGALTVDTTSPLTESVDYTATYGEDPDTGKWILNVIFAGTIDTAYSLQYRTSIYLSNPKGELVSNDISISGENNQTIEDSTDKNLTVHITEGGGTIYGTKTLLKLRKTNTNLEPLGGATFMLRDNKGNDLGPYTTAEDGTLTIRNIVSGEYTLFEVSAPEGYGISQELADGMPVQVGPNAEDGEALALVNDKSLVRLRKANAAGDPLEGAVYTLEVLSGDWAAYDDTRYTTDTDGVIEIRGLPDGHYRLIEQEAPDGYILDSRPIEFDIETGNNGVIHGADVTVINEQGSVKLAKTNDKGESLANAQYTLYDADGENVIAVYTTDEQGALTIEGLAPGSYQLIETQAPEGYIIDATPIMFSIDGTTDQTVEADDLGTFVNVKGSIAFRKVDDSGDALAGASFELIDEKDGHVVDIYESDDDGYVRATDLAPGDYHFIETAPVDGYVIDESELDFTIPASENGRAQELEIKDFANTRFTGSVQLVKKSVDDSATPLGGAQFDLYAVDADGKREKITEVTTDETGSATVDGLEAGQYEFVETAAPDGYAMSEEPLPFEIVYDEQGQQAIVVVEATNAKLPDPTPSPTPEVTPEPTPEVTPEPTPEVTPEPTPEVTPEPTPGGTTIPKGDPTPTPEPTPEVTPEPTPEVTPEPTPAETPQPTQTNPSTNPPGNGDKPPQTGDIGYWPWIALIAAGAIAIIIAVMLRRKKK